VVTLAVVVGGGVGGREAGRVDNRCQLFLVSVGRAHLSVLSSFLLILIEEKLWLLALRSLPL
jgi:hypothetical protein